MHSVGSQISIHSIYIGDVKEQALLLLDTLRYKI